MPALGWTPSVQGSCPGPYIQVQARPWPWQGLQQPDHHSNQSEKIIKNLLFIKELKIILIFMQTSHTRGLYLKPFKAKKV
jgi:hypothetical protein